MKSLINFTVIVCLLCSLTACTRSYIRYQEWQEPNEGLFAQVLSVTKTDQITRVPGEITEETNEPITAINKTEDEDNKSLRTRNITGVLSDFLKDLSRVEGYSYYYALVDIDNRSLELYSDFEARPGACLYIDFQEREAPNITEVNQNLCQAVKKP